MMRTFLAIDLDGGLRSELAALRGTVSTAWPEWAGEKWVDTHNLHLTLKFLGDRSANDLAEITETLAPSLRGVAPFESSCLVPVELAPRPHRPRMLWSRFDDPDGSFTALAHRIDGALCPLGIPPESRRLVPHVTLCRARAPKPASRRTDLPEVTVLSFMSVREVIVFTSELKRSGPVYARQTIIPLAMR
ncbi:MAG: RNA 2',3'-cyclic phosphodiesterase [Coriobacteriia bacterium]|jgi:2'-5' RNA ligase|nr:RNA 2',3'-cyclic phosphodiesterase [Coriobacteriia bacterium]